MNPSPSDAHQQDEPPNKKPQIGRRDASGRARNPRRVMKLAVIGATGSVGREGVVRDHCDGPRLIASPTSCSQPQPTAASRG